jgi:large subunit ribosomal protein L25
LQKLQFNVNIFFMNKLTAIKRSKTEKLADMRRNGMVPAVVYGARVENTMISVPSVLFGKILKEAGETSTISLEITEEKDSSLSKKVDVLIHEVQKDPIKGFPIHIDFLAVDMNKPIEIAVPLEFEGIAPADKNGLGVLVKALYEVEIRALPKDIPHSLSVDLSTLNTLEDQIQVKNIKLPPKIEMLTNEDEVVALVTPAEEEAETETVDVSSIEVEKKGKKEEAE